MKACRAILFALTVATLLGGCSTTDDGMSQKEREKMAREMEKADRKEAQSQAKMMRDTGQRRTTR